jgi:hypothetical protein
MCPTHMEWHWTETSRKPQPKTIETWGFFHAFIIYLSSLLHKFDSSFIILLGEHKVSLISCGPMSVGVKFGFANANLM